MRPEIPTPENEYIKTFDVSLEGLDPSERETSDHLFQACIDTVPMFQLQKGNGSPRANFYPPDTSVDEVEGASVDNPDLLSEFTMVARENGKLVALPYH